MLELDDAERQIFNKSVPKHLRRVDDYSDDELKIIYRNIEQWTPPEDRESLRWAYGNLLNSIKEEIEHRGNKD